VPRDQKRVSIPEDSNDTGTIELNLLKGAILLPQGIRRNNPYRQGYQRTNLLDRWEATSRTIFSKGFKQTIARKAEFDKPE
jgi:hypothetical protein